VTKNQSPKNLKLVVYRETLRNLDEPGWLHKVKGGYLWPPTQTTCGSAHC
jgi:hypothetical protein